MSKRVFVINPGSTSTKIAVYDGEEALFQETIRHSAEELSVFPQISDQEEFRSTRSRWSRWTRWSVEGA